jgi:hypothetical protein
VGRYGRAPEVGTVILPIARFFIGQVGLDVHLCGRRALVPEPQCNYRNVNSRLKKVHCS